MDSDEEWIIEKNPLSDSYRAYRPIGSGYRPRSDPDPWDGAWFLSVIVFTFVYLPAIFIAGGMFDTRWTSDEGWWPLLFHALLAPLTATLAVNVIIHGLCAIFSRDTRRVMLTFAVASGLVLLPVAIWTLNTAEKIM